MACTVQAGGVITLIIIAVRWDIRKRGSRVIRRACCAPLPAVFIN